MSVTPMSDGNSFPRQFGDHMNALCSRPDFLGRLSRHYLTDADSAARHRRSPASPRTPDRKPRLSLRPLASYRTMLLLLLLYVCGALLSFGPASSAALVLAAGFLYGLFMTVFGHKVKTP